MSDKIKAPFQKRLTLLWWGKRISMEGR